MTNQKTAIAIAALLASSLTGCASMGQPIERKFTNDRLTVNVVEISDADRLKRQCMALNAKTDNASGCAVVSTDTKSCTIYVPTPKGEGDADSFGTIGHELWHCRHGSFHEVRENYVRDREQVESLRNRDGIRISE